VVDLATKDPNYITHWRLSNVGSGETIFANDTHLFVFGNGLNFFPSEPTGRLSQYIGRFDINTFAAAGGRYLKELVYNDTDFALDHANYAGAGKIAIQLSAVSQLRYSILTIDDTLDPATAALYWTVDAPFPANDDFASAQPVGLSLPIYADLSYASTEANEQPPGYASTGDSNFFPWYSNNYHSVWYKFTAPATTSYDINVFNNAASAHTADAFGIAVYTGSSLAGLSYVTGYKPTFGISGSSPSHCTISATKNTVYYISVTSWPFFDSLNGGSLVVRPYHWGRFILEVTNHS
jgi:hypothetical protein